MDAQHSQDAFGDPLGKVHVPVNFPTGHQLQSPPSLLCVQPAMVAQQKVLS